MGRGASPLSTGKKKKSAQRENCELSFIWGKMRTLVQGTAFQTALTNCSKEVGEDFSGGSVVKNPPANAGNTGLSPGPGRSHMPWSN